MLGSYLYTLDHALLNVKTPTLGFKRFNRTDELLNGPCSHETIWTGQEVSLVMCSYWSWYSEVEMKTVSIGEEGAQKNGGW